VGIDLLRRRSVIVRKNADGELLSKVHIDNDPVAMADAIAAAGPNPDVVLEATFGWYWCADLLTEMGATVHLAHPLSNNWGNRRVKNDEPSAYAGQATIEVPPDFAAALCRDPSAKVMFNNLNASNRYAILYRVTTAKRPDTRRRRIEQFAAMLARGDTIHPQRDTAPRRKHD